MCKFENWNYSCGHGDQIVINRHSGKCDEKSILTAQIEYPCKACRERQQVIFIKNWRQERRRYLVQFDNLERQEKSTRAAKERLVSLHKRTLRALQALNIDDPYRGLTFEERLVLRKTYGELTVKTFLSRMLGGCSKVFRK